MCSSCNNGYRMVGLNCEQNTCSCPNGVAAANCLIHEAVWCTSCSKGYGKTGTSNKCTNCAAGTFQDETGKSVCKQCPIGKYQDQTGQFDCKTCAKHSYQDQTGQSDCKTCSSGTFLEIPNGATQESDCKSCMGNLPAIYIPVLDYKVKTSGKCTDDIGWGYITDLEKCMTAAKQLELSTASETVATIANNNGSPTGCLFYNNWGSERRPQLNNGASEPCGSNGYHCLCKRIPIHTLTCGEGGCVCKRNELPKGCSTYNNKAYWSDNSNENHQNQYTKVDIIPDSSFTIDSILYEIMNTSKCIQSGGISISDQEECAKIEFESFTTTWVNTDKMNPVEEWTAITSSSDGKILTAVVFGGNIWRSSDSGTSWTIVGTEKSWSDITSSSDGKILTAVALMHGIWRSIDSGTTWTWVLNKQKWWKSITSSSDGTKLAAVVINGHIWTSFDSGTTWTEDTSVGKKNWSLITSSHNGKILAAVVEDEYIWTSFDSGTTWTKDTSVGVIKEWISLMSSPTKLSAVTSNGDIWTTAFPCSTADNIICAMRRTCNQNNEEFKFGFEGDGFTKQCLAK